MITQQSTSNSSGSQAQRVRQNKELEVDLNQILIVNMSGGDDQQGMLGIPNEGNITNGGIITHDQMPFGSTSVPIPSWSGDYMPQPTNPEQYGNWFSATEDQGSSQQQKLLLEQAGWISSPAEAQGSNQILLESSSMQMNTNIPAAPSSKQRIINGCYDPMFEAMGLPLDPHLRVFLSKLNAPASNGGK